VATITAPVFLDTCITQGALDATALVGFAAIVLAATTDVFNKQE